jgi:hypothetical protein
MPFTSAFESISPVLPHAQGGNPLPVVNILQWRSWRWLLILRLLFQSNNFLFDFVYMYTFAVFIRPVEYIFGTQDTTGNAWQIVLVRPFYLTGPWLGYRSRERWRSTTYLIYSQKRIMRICLIQNRPVLVYIW